MQHLLGLASCLLPAVLLAQDDPGTSYRFRLPAPIDLRAHVLVERSFDTLHGTNADGSLDVIVLPEELVEFRRFTDAMRLRPRLIDRGRPYGEAGPSAPDQNYYTVAEIEQEIDKLVQAHPGFARKVDLTTLPGAARTHENRAIFALKVSDNVAKDEDEPAIVVAAQHHARELNAPHMVIRAMQRVLATRSSDPAIGALMRDHEVYFVPCVNPDGVHHVWNRDNYWRKNRRNNGGGVYGVDLNRNYDFLWGRCGSSTNPGSQTYRGPAPASEPETRTMVALARAVRPEVYIDFHSYGQEVLSNYPSCATVSAPLRALNDFFVDDLRGPMSYARRPPSASAEAPHWFFAETGSNSYLIEVGRSFQPSFTTTVAEEARVWPGLKRALTTWTPAVRGHVRSIQGSKPLAAEITVSPGMFAHGETSRTRTRDGRYAVWLPPGAWTLTIRAPGHDPVQRRVTVAAFNRTTDLDVALVPTGPPATLQKTGTDRLGTTTTLTYTSPGDATRAYWIALSGGTTPGIALGDRTIPLNADGLLFASATPNAVMLGNVGTLDAAATGVARLPIPPLAALVGLRVWAGGITLDDGWSFSVVKFSGAVGITFQR